MSTQTIFLTAGATSKSVDVFLVQNAGATSPGNPITGLAYNTSSLTGYYRKGATGTLTAITLATQTVGGAYSSGGFVEISSTNAPGAYRFDIPDTVIATAGEANITFNGAANLATHMLKIIVTAVDFYDTVRMGLTALPNAVAAGSGGLLTSGTGSNQLTTASGQVTVATNNDKTGYTASTVSDKTGYTLSNTGIDALYTRQLTESYNADNVAPTLAQAIFGIQQMIAEVSVSGTTLTVKKLDGATTAMTFTLNDGTSPTSRTRST